MSGRVGHARRRGSTWNLLQNLTLREIRSQYKRTALGRLWSLINPLAQIGIYGIVFGVLLRIEAAPGTNSGLHIYALWLAVGIVVWNFLSGGVRDAMQSFVGYQGLLKKVALPRWTLPMSKVASRMFTFLTELAVVALICGIVGGWQIVIRIAALVPLLAILAVFVYGLGLLLAVALVYFRDVEHIWSIATQVWFYASGVMIPVRVVESAQAAADRAGYEILGHPLPLLAAFEANPGYQFLAAFRAVLYDFELPDWRTVLVLLAWSLVTLAVGMLVYRRHQAKIVEEL